MEIDPNKASEIRSAKEFRDEIARTGDRTKPFGLQWASSWWLKWALVHHALRTLEVPSSGRLLELGSGTGPGEGSKQPRKRPERR